MGTHGGKHSMENNKSNKRILLVLLIIILIGLGAFFGYKNKDSIFKIIGKEKVYEIKEKTIEGEKLVLKSNSGDSRFIEFLFEDGKLTKLKIFEKFDDKAKYKEKKEQYSQQDIYKITKAKDRKLILEVEKSDLEEDEGLTYDEIYEKYVNQIIGAYEVKE